MGNVGTVHGTVHAIREEGKVEWKIDDFLQLQNNCSSPEFNVSGASGKLSFTLIRREQDESFKFANIRVLLRSMQLIDEYCANTTVTFSLKTVDGRSYLEKTAFLNKTFKMFYLNYFISRSHLIERQSELLPFGTLTVICTLKDSGSNAASDDIQISSVSRKRKFLQTAQMEGATGLGTPPMPRWSPPTLPMPRWSPPTLPMLRLSCPRPPIPRWSRPRPPMNRWGPYPPPILRQGPRTTPGSSLLHSSDLKDDVQIPSVSAERHFLEASSQTEEAAGCDKCQLPAVNPCNKTLVDFKELFLKQEDCDVVLKVRGREFSAHRAILGARSSVFASAFRSDMKEKATGVINIEDCDPSSFSDFLCFLYCGNKEDISTTNVFGLFFAADKYDVQDLRSECLKFMKNNLSVDTFCDTIALALRHSEQTLIDLATDFFGENLKEIIPTVKWQTFVVENPIQSNEILIKALANKRIV